MTKKEYSKFLKLKVKMSAKMKELNELIAKNDMYKVTHPINKNPLTIKEAKESIQSIQSALDFIKSGARSSKGAELLAIQIKKTLPGFKGRMKSYDVKNEIPADDFARLVKELGTVEEASRRVRKAEKKGIEKAILDIKKQKTREYREEQDFRAIENLMTSIGTIKYQAESVGNDELLREVERLESIIMTLPINKAIELLKDIKRKMPVFVNKFYGSDMDLFSPYDVRKMSDMVDDLEESYI